MTPIDRDILQRLQNRDDELVLTLRDRELVGYDDDEERSIYQLSDRGRAWLAGGLPTGRRVATRPQDCGPIIRRIEAR
jgi:hypothetical protein